MSVKNSVLKYGIAAVILAVAIALVSSGFISSMLSSGQNSGSLYVVQLTDPPSVPSGTVWLNLTYSNLELHAENLSQWISTGASGTVDLLSLQNVSETIGSAYVPTGDVINAVRFNVTNVEIDVGGSIYPVFMPSGQLTVPLIGANRVEGTSVALLDFSPMVHDTSGGFGGRSYMLVPSIVGVVKQNTGNAESQSTRGSMVPLNSQDLSQLKQAAGSIQVVSSVLTVSNGQTSFIITLKNGGSAPVTFYIASLEGNFMQSIVAPPSCQVHCPAPSQPQSRVGEVLFAWSGSGNALVQLGSGGSNVSESMVVSAGQTVTLSFTGTISFAGGVDTLTPISGATYSGQIDASNGGVQFFSITAE